MKMTGNFFRRLEQFVSVYLGMTVHLLTDQVMRTYVLIAVVLNFLEQFSDCSVGHILSFVVANIPVSIIFIGEQLSPIAELYKCH